MNRETFEHSIFVSNLRGEHSTAVHVQLIFSELYFDSRDRSRPAVAHTPIQLLSILLSTPKS